MAAQQGKSSPQTFDQLSRQQLEIYAKELREVMEKERTLRRDMESQNKKLEQRIREITALNQLFQRHLDERLVVVNAYRSLIQTLERMGVQLTDIIKVAKSAPIPDLDESPGMPDSTDSGEA